MGLDVRRLSLSSVKSIVGEPNILDFLEVDIYLDECPTRDAPFAKLRRERPTKNLIGNSYLEMIVALDAWNRLVV